MQRQRHRWDFGILMWGCGEPAASRIGTSIAWRDPLSVCLDHEVELAQGKTACHGGDGNPKECREAGDQFE